MRIADTEAMVALGERIGAQLRRGDAVCLTGQLGAGKTTLTRGIVAGLGITAAVSSPTFVISRRYPGTRADLVHCDAYRLAPDDDFADIVPDPEDVVTVVEWGAEVMAAFCDSWLVITLDRSTGEGDEARTVTIEGVGDQWDDARVSQLLGVRP